MMMEYPLATERDFVDANNTDADTLRAILPAGYTLGRPPEGGRFYAVVSTPSRGRQMARLNVRDVADVPGVDAAYLVVRGSTSWDKNWRLVLARAGEAPELVTDDGDRQGVRTAIPGYREDDRPDTPFTFPHQRPTHDLPGEDTPEFGPRLATLADVRRVARLRFGPDAVTYHRQGEPTRAAVVRSVEVRTDYSPELHGFRLACEDKGFDVGVIEQDDGFTVTVQPDVSAQERRKDRLSRHDPRHPNTPTHAL